MSHASSILAGQTPSLVPAQPPTLLPVPFTWRAQIYLQGSLLQVLLHLILPFIIRDFLDVGSSLSPRASMTSHWLWGGHILLALLFIKHLLVLLYLLGTFEHDKCKYNTTLASILEVFMIVYEKAVYDTHISKVWFSILTMSTVAVLSWLWISCIHLPLHSWECTKEGSGSSHRISLTHEGAHLLFSIPHLSHQDSVPNDQTSPLQGTKMTLNSD